MVSGSDRSDSALLEDLRGQGINVSLHQDGSAVPADVELFVYSEAIPEDAEERVKATKLGVRQISYCQALGELSCEYTVIAVCGTHGKSSTTAMAAKVLVDAGFDPTVVVGTKTPDLGGRNWRKGESDLFLLEACEYRRSFLHLSPSMILMTNADGDHFDSFGSIEEYQQAFVSFVSKLSEDGLLITHMDDPDCARIAEEAGTLVRDADEEVMPVLAVPGRHMSENAQLVMALADTLGIDPDATRASLLAYQGAWRRMEPKGDTVHGVPVFDDYAHHPREIRATIAALCNAYPDRRLVCVFQPHTHDRTIKLYDEFLGAFTDADLVVVSDIYNARNDIETGIVDVEKFVTDLAKASDVETISGRSLTETERLLRQDILRAGDLLLVMGAGDVTALAGTMVVETYGKSL